MILFRTEYGSRAMGMATEDSDHDVMEVHLEPREAITGLAPYRATHKSTAGDGRSGPGDVDTVRYGLKKWASLAAKGNPTAATPLWKNPDAGGDEGFELLNVLGAKLIFNRSLFVSKDMVRQSRGYARHQREALMGTRNKKTNRPELVHTHGYDTKFAYHALRTLMQAHELMIYGKVELPIPGYNARLLQDIRNGRVDKETFLEYFDIYDAATDKMLNGEFLTSVSLPDHADYEGINKLLHEIYQTGWYVDFSGGNYGD